MAGKFVVKAASNGDIYFRLQAGNGGRSDPSISKVPGAPPAP
jgi:hypothetical protein